VALPLGVGTPAALCFFRCPVSKFRQPLEKRFIRCVACRHILAAVIAGRVVVSAQRTQFTGDLRFLDSITCGDCGRVWYRGDSEPTPPGQPVETLT
jgi:uncharacterized protein with PIN domain